MATSSNPNANPASVSVVLIVLIIVIPSILLVGICVARRTPLLASIRGSTAATPRRPSRASGPVGDAALQLMPVVKYDQGLVATLDASDESHHVKETTAPKQSSRPKPKFYHSVLAALSRPRRLLSLERRRERKKLPDLETQSTSPSSAEPTPVEARERRLAMQTCAICTEDFRHGINVRQLPCGHIYHPPCIDPWLLGFAATCPLCRIDLSTRQASDSVAEPARVAVPPQAAVAQS